MRIISYLLLLLALVISDFSNGQDSQGFFADDFKYGDRCYIYSLTGGDDNGEFSQKVFINGSGPDNLTGGPVNNLQNIKALSQKINDGIKLVLPPWSVHFLLW